MVGTRKPAVNDQAVNDYTLIDQAATDIGAAVTDIDLTEAAAVPGTDWAADIVLAAIEPFATGMAVVPETATVPGVDDRFSDSLVGHTPTGVVAAAAIEP